MSDAEHLSMCLLPICMSSLEKCLFKSLPTFWLGCLFFGYWVVWAVCIFWKLILCQVFHLLLFSTIRGLSFHLAYSFLCCAKTFKVNQLPLVYFCFYFHYSRWCHSRRIGPQDALKKDSWGLSRVAAGNPGFPWFVSVTLAATAAVSNRYW